MVDSLICYNKSVKTLKSTGFQLNPYDTCVTNQLVSNKHQNISFHVYDCNLGHQCREVNDELINALCDKYKSVFEDGS